MTDQGRQGRQWRSSLRPRARSPGGRIDSSHYLYIAVIVAVLAGITVGLVGPEFAVGAEADRRRVRAAHQDDDRPDHLLHDRRSASARSRRRRPSARSAAWRCCYFMVMSTFALGDRPRGRQPHPPGRGPEHRRTRTYDAGAPEAEDARASSSSASSRPRCSRRSSTATSCRCCSSRCSSASRCRRWARRARRSSARSGSIQALVFRILAMIMWVAPIGAFGAIAAVVGNTGVAAIIAPRHAHGRLLHHVRAVHRRSCSARCCRLVTRVNIFQHDEVPRPRVPADRRRPRRARSALPRLIAKMEHAGRLEAASPASRSPRATRSTSTAPRSTSRWRRCSSRARMGTPLVARRADRRCCCS